MATKIIIPKLGLSTEPLQLVEWKAKEGDGVEKGTIILVVETGKISYDVEAEASGFLHILVETESEAPIGSAAGLIAETREELAALKEERPAVIAAPAAKVETESEAPIGSAAGLIAETREELAALKEERPAVIAAPAAKVEGGRIRISPAARKLAEEHVIDISKVRGSGPEGRIVREDIEREIRVEKEVAPTQAEVVPGIYQGRRVKSTTSLTGMRKTIAEHMHHSLSVAAQLTVMGEIDMAEMTTLRESLLTQEKDLGTRITYTDLLVLTVAKALRDYPIINSSLIDNEVKLWEDINIAVAVAIEDGLIVPVIKNADQKSLAEISRIVKTLSKKARERTLVPEEVEGGTFTVTNLGALGGGYRFETVIINQPESAILGTGGITDRAVVREGQIVIRPIMTYYFTYDHRVVNGAVAAKFMAGLTRLLENPILLLS